MKINGFFVFGVGYICLLVGMCIASTGQMSGPSEPYPWHLSLTMLAVLLPVFISGILAGKAD